MAVHHQICHQHLLEISYFALLHVIPNTTCASSTSVGFTSQRAIHANCCPFPEVHPTREPGTRQHTGRINCSCSRNVPQTAELPQDPGGAAGVCSSLNAHTGHKPSSSGCTLRRVLLDFLSWKWMRTGSWKEESFVSSALQCLHVSQN